MTGSDDTAPDLRARIAAIPWNVAGQERNPVGGCDEEWAVSEYRDAVLAEIDRAATPSSEPSVEPGLREASDPFEHRHGAMCAYGWCDIDDGGLR